MIIVKINITGANKKVENKSVDDSDFPTIKDASLIAKGMKYDKIKKDKQEKKPDNSDQKGTVWYFEK